MPIDRDLQSAHEGPFRLDVAPLEDGCRLVLAGEFDLAAIEPVHDALERALADRPATLEIDLSALTFMDSSGLRALLEARDRAAAEDVALRLRRGPQEVQRVFALTGLEDELPFVD